MHYIKRKNAASIINSQVLPYIVRHGNNTSKNVYFKPVVNYFSKILVVPYTFIKL